LAGSICGFWGLKKFSRDDLKKSIEDNGGKVGSSISTKPIMFLLEIINIWK
jgi:NAD-dependent DNA ligase